ncbi:terminase large subunit [Mycolicibacterium brisbanense]|uniref:Phage terminase n=1 Tax=Mycolicibacterium brisbanense TaxID=146020 RepID=A0A117I5R2_9MYCO|nr:terminase large subunit [Mycolicibacterium brisbanense]MCV7156138.1 terminase [Mycolicibacterium brisbanense]GAS88895.1 phage terminase [Mycolicibacterium brisbanense]
MAAGPKRAADPTPLPFVSDKVGAERFAQFCAEFLVTPKGHGVGEPMRLRDWQVDMLRPILDPEPRPSVAGIMCPRGTGKTSLMAALGLYELFTGPDGNEIPIVAVDERQAGLTLRPAIRMVELNPALASRCQVYRDHIVIPSKGSTLTALPAEAKRLEGLGTWTLALADEVGVISPDTWDTLLLGLGKLPGATAIGIGTPPNAASSVLLNLRQYAQDHPDDSTFAWVEFSADEFQHHRADCEHCWELACPSLDDFLTRESMRALLNQTPEGKFRRARLCQFITENANPFIDADTWAVLDTGQPIPDRSEVVIALDGSYGGRDSDATALVMGTVSPTPHFDVLAVWENDGSPEWRVPVLEVEQAIRDARTRWRVTELVADPFRWTRTLQVLAAEGLKVTEFPWSPSRTTKATTALYAAATAGKFTHSGNEILTRHVLAATVIESNGGLRIGKASRRRSAAKIDCAAALLMAHSRATWLGSKTKKRTTSFR